MSMAATVNLVLGPVGAGKSDRLLARYREIASHRIGSAIWIAPTERACDDLLEVLSRTAGCVLAPRVMTFPKLAAELAGPVAQNRILPEPHQQMLLEELLGELHRQKHIPYFGPLTNKRGVVDAIYSFISELKGRGITPGEFDDCLGRLEGARDRKKDSEIALIFARYHLLFREKHWLDRESQYASALERLRADAKIAGASALFVDSFVAFTPPQIQLLQALAHGLDELWITLPYDSPDEGRPELNTPGGATLAELERTLPNATRIELPIQTSSPRPAGLERLRRDLFREGVTASEDASGISLIEAPGLVGEVRMVSRAVKQLLLDGVSPATVVVSARSLSAYVELISEVFGEYGLPVDLEANESLAGRPIVAALLSAAGLAEADWPFAETTALLRSTFFRPEWPEIDCGTDARADAEITLRLLGEPRGRANYLSAAKKWADAPETPLEDEEAGGSASRRKHSLAKTSLPLLEKFFTIWDDAPKSATFADHVAWLREFTLRIGCGKSEDDANGLDRLWHELDRWAVRQSQQHREPPAMSHTEFLRITSTLATSVGVPRVERSLGGVRVVPAELVPGLNYDHLFIMALGEGSFPNLSGSGALYDERERLALREAGLDVALTDDRLAEEMLLFHRLLAQAQKSVTLSYAAVDEKGQDLLPGTFLQAVRMLFTETSLSRTHRKMLVEQIDTQRTYSPAEYRVRNAIAGGDGSALPTSQRDHLSAAAEIIRRRFNSSDFGAFDGMLTQAKSRTEVANRTGPKKVFSASGLNNYIACPFRYFMGQILALAPIEDPDDDIEWTRRGAAFHRALARLHRRPTHLLRDVGQALSKEIDFAIAEEAERAGSPATKAIWQLEGERLHRAALRYQTHLDKLRGTWREAGLDLAPSACEADFSADSPLGPLMVNFDGVEVRLHGRIDRIDSCKLDDESTGYLVIDYKSGRAPSLTDAAKLEDLQLAVYALAADRMLGANARPLGLAYWKLADDGPSMHPRKKTGWLDTPQAWPNLRDRLIQWLATIVRRMRAAEFPLKPRNKRTCDYCDYHSACRISQSRHIEKNWELPLPMVEP